MTAGPVPGLHRRAVLAGLGAAATAPLLRPARLCAAAPLFRRSVGSIEVTAVSDGALNVPLSFMLPETSPQQAAALFAAHGLPAAGSPFLHLPDPGHGLVERNGLAYRFVAL